MVWKEEKLNTKPSNQKWKETETWGEFVMKKVSLIQLGKRSTSVTYVTILQTVGVKLPAL